ncbi:MAG: DUF4124 domain-containing protein [Pseudomonadota bacterium]|nr:DUF4124 domain-containing protein [Pseudomonadota bacterium]
MSRHYRQPLCLLLAVFAATLAPDAGAQVNRCVTPDGGVLYTDRPCREMGGVEAVRAPRAPAGGHFYRGCSRNLRDLVFEMTTAFDMQDANRLASVYHWPGMSGRSGNGVMSRLDAMVQRPLVDIVPVMPGERDGTAPYYPQDSSRQRPVGLRVEQTLANGITPARTVFGLTRHFGCWWIRG